MEPLISHPTYTHTWARYWYSYPTIVTEWPLISYASYGYLHGHGLGTDIVTILVSCLNMPAYLPLDAHFQIRMLKKVYNRIIHFFHQAMSFASLWHIVAVFLNNKYIFMEILWVGLISQGGCIWAGNQYNNYCLTGLYVWLLAFPSTLLCKSIKMCKK